MVIYCARENINKCCSIKISNTLLSAHARTLKENFESPELFMAMENFTSRETNQLLLSQICKGDLNCTSFYPKILPERKPSFTIYLSNTLIDYYLLHLPGDFEITTTIYDQSILSKMIHLEVRIQDNLMKFMNNRIGLRSYEEHYYLISMSTQPKLLI